MKKPKVVYAVPEGWSLALCLDDGRLYFVKPNTLKANPETRRRIREKYGGLIVAEKVYDYSRNLVYLPPPRDPENVQLRFRKIVEHVGEFKVCRGGELA